jgi:hypothetical protein
MNDDPEANAAAIHAQRTAVARASKRSAGVLSTLRSAHRNLAHQVWGFIVLFFLRRFIAYRVAHTKHKHMRRLRPPLSWAR